MRLSKSYGFLIYSARTNIVQVTENGIPSNHNSSDDTKKSIPEDSLLEPANAVADIDTFFMEEGLEVDLI